MNDYHKSWRGELWDFDVWFDLRQIALGFRSVSNTIMLEVGPFTFTFCYWSNHD